MIFPSRRKRGPDTYLEWKVRAFFLGGVLALVGIATDTSLLVVLAILVLLLGILLRFLPAARGESDTGTFHDGPDEGDGEGVEGPGEPRP